MSTTTVRETSFTPALQHIASASTICPTFEGLLLDFASEERMAARYHYSTFDGLSSQLTPKELT
jgi:hypothetical protein